MLWYCAFTWFPGTSRTAVARRIVEQHDAGKTPRERIRGWYNLAGGGAGFLLIEADNPRELTGYLQPYMDLMSWDVRAIYGFEYDETIAQLRQVSEGTASA